MFHKVEGYTHIKKSHGKYKRKTVRILLTLIPIVVLVGIVGGFAYNAGFIPIKEFLSVREPIGNSVELDIDSYMEEYPELEGIPNLDKIKYSVYGTDASTNAVVNDYRSDLENEGYTVKYEGTKDLEGRHFRVIGFLKGFTAVGIVVTSDTDDEFGSDTAVIYATGSAFDFQEILDWYQEN